jgi:hypothetical protein
MMRPLSAVELLAVWEENWRQPPLWQGLALLAAACPDESGATLMEMPVGRFNQRLLTLYGWCFGPSFTAVTTCAACSELVEVTLDAPSLCAQGVEQPASWLELDCNDGAVRFRLPTLGDLIAAGEAATVLEASRMIMERCLENPADALASETLAAVTTAMENADPLALIELSGACPRCGQRWSAFLDAASFVWREVQTWAQRTLQEIHLLARAYGWREAEILELSPTRRQAYLQMIYG